MAIKRSDPEGYRALLVDMLKAAGQDIIDKAEDLIGHDDLLSDLDIRIILPVNGDNPIDVSPSIEICRTTIVKDAADQLVNYHTKRWLRDAQNCKFEE